MRGCMQYDAGFTDEAMVRRAITAYFGLVSFLDHNIGRVLAALDEAGLMADTRVIYSSDHGDNLGARGRKLLVGVAEGTGLLGADRRVVLRIEEQHEPLPPQESGRVKGAPVLKRGRERGSPVTDRDRRHGDSFS
jgi:hypothetical protein